MLSYQQVLLLLLFLCFYNCLAQDKFTEPNNKVRKFIENFKQKEKLPGLSVTISYNDTIIFSEGFGYADIENKITINPAQTKFRIASVTKMLTASTIVKMAESGLIDTKKSVYYYLDSLPKKQHDFTIEQVGGHLAGLQRIAGEEKYLCDNTYGKKDFYRVFNNDLLLFKPAENFSYSNYGFKVLGVIVEKITGESITKNHEKYIIQPLQLKNTITDNGIHDSLTSKFYTIKKGEAVLAPCLDCTFKYASGCYLSTSEDLIKIGNAYLFVGRLLNKESLLKLVTSQKLTNGKKTNYGFGFVTVNRPDGTFYYGHNGGYDGISSSTLRIYPKSKLVISILVNTSMDDIGSLASKISEFYIGKTL